MSANSNSLGYPRIEGDWYFETERSGFAQGLRVRERIVQQATAFQRMEVMDTDPFGRVLILDDALQISEYDEFMYHEMIVHVPLMTHPRPERVLIVGGGDGGTLRRAVEHPTVHAVQVEIDEAVIVACKDHIPSISAGAFDHPRARVVIGDGIEFIRESPGQFDVIIVDSTDPIGPAVDLFGVQFYRDVAAALAPDGLLAAQSSSPVFMAGELRQQVQSLRKVFPIVRTYLGIVVGYPGSLWSYTIGSKQHDPLGVDRAAISQRLAAAAIETRYYTPDVHYAAFVLPPFVAEIVAPASAA